MARQIIVEIVGDAGKFGKATDSAIKKGKGFGTAIKGVGIGLGVGVFNLATSALSGFVGALGEAQQAYREDQVSQTNLRTALKNTIPAWDGSTDRIEKYAAAQARLGFQDDEIRASISQLIGITHDEAKAIEISALAQDLARAKGIDLASATDILTKAAQGNGKALKGLGIDVSGVTTAAGFLDAAQKNVKGSAEAWAKTSEGKQAAAAAKNAESWEKIGGVVDRVSQVILPIAADALSLVADVISNVASAIGPVVSKLSKELGPTFQVIGRIAGGVFSGISTAIGIAWGIVKGIFTVWKTEIGILTGLFRGIGTVVSSVWKGVTSAIKGAINAVIGIINGAIRGINKIQVHIHVGPVGYDFNGLNLKQIPYLHAGGIVPGMPGSDVPAMLQAGERVIPAGGGGQTIIVNIESFTGSDRDVDRFAERLADRLRHAGA